MFRALSKLHVLSMIFRIGYELVSADAVAPELVQLVNETVMDTCPHWEEFCQLFQRVLFDQQSLLQARAVAYWASVLQVRQAWDL